MNPLVLTEQQGDMWVLTLNRPDKLNAMSSEWVDQLQAAVDQAHTHGARVLVLKGAGKSFCAGFDLSDLEQSSEADLLLRFVRIELLLQSIANSPCLTLALAHGKVFGAGVDLFAVCKERVVTEDTVFRMPGLKFGLVLGTRRFAEIVGKERALSVLETTSYFNCTQALEMNFVHACVGANEWSVVIDSANKKSHLLDSSTQASLYSVLGMQESDKAADLYHLIKSAARPGLKARLIHYVNSQSLKKMI
jgi:enoyl-CoA hydratase/carnithine racemase